MEQIPHIEEAYCGVWHSCFMIYDLEIHEIATRFFSPAA